MMDRRAISQKRRAQICLAQDGRCFVCGDKLRPGKIEIDHRQALVHGGDDADDNLAALCVTCHCEKTKSDVKGLRKAERIAIGGRQRRGKPMDGSKLSPFKKHMNGEVSRR